MPPYVPASTSDECVAVFVDDEQQLLTTTSSDGPTSNAAEVEKQVPAAALAAEEKADDEATGSNSTIIVFDWDDTLYPSSWVHGNGYDLVNAELSDLSEQERSLLAAFEDIILIVLDRAMRLGKVMIVTDAEQDWVELSASIFMPRVAALLERSSVLVVSARSSFERKHPFQPSEWKRETFVKYVYGYHSNAVDFFPRNIISVGDGPNERAALHSLVNSVPGLLGKCVKLVTRPTVEELHVQMEMLLGFLTYICRSADPLDLQLSKEKV